MTDDEIDSLYAELADIDAKRDALLARIHAAESERATETTYPTMAFDERQALQAAIKRGDADAARRHALRIREMWLTY